MTRRPLLPRRSRYAGGRRAYCAGGAADAALRRPAAPQGKGANESWQGLSEIRRRVPGQKRGEKCDFVFLQKAS